ncbi:MAG: DUF1772 domain-containing protein [Actinomycetota bacterium]
MTRQPAGVAISVSVATVLTGLSAGFFYAYAASVIPGLADVNDATYVAAFRALNDNVQSLSFAAVFFGPLLAIAIALALAWPWSGPPRMLIGVAFVLYLGVLSITRIGNVPLNNELADAAVSTVAEAASARAEFESEWNRLNLFRTIAAIGSFALLAAAAGFSSVRSASSP